MMMLSNSPSMLMDKSDLSMKVQSSDIYNAMPPLAIDFIQLWTKL